MEQARPPEARLRVIFETHRDHVAAYALRRTVDREQAKEIVAETFAVAWKRIDSVPPDPLPWLLATARNVLRNQRRAERRRLRLSSRLRWERPKERHDFSATLADRSEVLEALQRLSEEDRELVLLVAWEGLSHRGAKAVVGAGRLPALLRSNGERVRLMRRLRQGLTPFAKVRNVGREGLANALTYLAPADTERHDARQVGNERAPSAVAGSLKDDQVLAQRRSSNPVARRMLARVPTGTVSLGLPATTTRRLLFGCAQIS